MCARHPSWGFPKVSCRKGVKGRGAGERRLVFPYGIWAPDSTLNSEFSLGKSVVGGGD